MTRKDRNMAAIYESLAAGDEPEPTYAEKAAQFMQEMDSLSEPELMMATVEGDDYVDQALDSGARIEASQDASKGYYQSLARMRAKRTKDQAAQARAQAAQEAREHPFAKSDYLDRVDRWAWEEVGKAVMQIAKARASMQEANEVHNLIKRLRSDHEGLVTMWFEIQSRDAQDTWNR